MKRRDFGSFRRSLSNHPGLYTAGLMTGAGSLAGISGHMAEAFGYGKAALVGATIMGAFAWLPVLWTAWARRDLYRDNSSTETPR